MREEVAQYFTSVHRCDQVVGGVLEELRASGFEDDTLVVFLSDNGMAFPFAKANCYLASTRTPWIVRWPGRVEAGAVDSERLISGIDYMATVLEAAGLEPVPGMDGRSLVPLFEGGSQPDRDHVFTEFHRTFAKRDYPMRCVQGRRYGYIYNAWARKTPPMRMDSTNGLTFRAMKRAAQSDPDIAARVALFEHRVPEELYDFQADPNGLVNLIDERELRAEIERLRERLAARMERTGDPLLEQYRAEVLDRGD